MTDRRALLRQLPAIDRLLNTAPLQELAGHHAHAQLRAAAQQAVDELRRLNNLSQGQTIQAGQKLVVAPEGR